MEIFHMQDVISLLGLERPPSGKSSYYIHCPCCDEKPRQKHLNINLKKQVFRCPRCGISGGIFDLYSLFTGVPREEVKDALVAKLGMPENRPKQKKAVIEKQVNEYPITDVDIRHATYSALLNKLELAPDHRKNLQDRGLKDEEIERLGYKTMPLAVGALAKQLQTEGYYLSGVPGFYRNEKGNWTLVHEKRGILIPVRDTEGRIQGLKIRLDNVVKRKFRWISSVDREDGCPAETFVHIAGPIRPTILLIEGPMKADIVHALTGFTVVAAPGVHALGHLQEFLKELYQSGVREIRTVFDMDMLINPHVTSGYNNLMNLLNEMNFRYSTYLWDPRFNGLDDYVWEYLYKKQR